MMKEKIFENGIQYSLHDDYYIPDLKLNEETRPINRWGRMRRDYLRERRPVLYNQLILSDKLWSHLADAQEVAQARLDLLIRQMAAAEGVNEEMKEANQMGWVQRMNSIRRRAAEIVLSEIVYE